MAHGSAVIGNTVGQNDVVGIRAGRAVTIRDNTVRFNSGSGDGTSVDIRAESGSLVSGNVIRSNEGLGLAVDPGVGAVGYADNNGGSANAHAGASATDPGGNIYGTHACP